LGFVEAMGEQVAAAWSTGTLDVVHDGRSADAKM
jgi:hypothetical protein